MLATNRYDPYGNVMSQYGSATSVFGYTGEQWDAATGLEYLRARYYSAAQGRFAQPDTIIPNPMDPPSLSRYAYVNDNPVNHTDPTGHQDGTAARTLQSTCFSNLAACFAAIAAAGGVVLGYMPIAVAGGVTGFLIWYSFANEPYPLPYPWPTTHPAPPTVAPKPWTTPEPCYWSADGCKPVPAVRQQPKPAPQPQPKPAPQPWDPFAPPCPKEGKQAFYYAIVSYQTAADYRDGYDALYQQLVATALPGTAGGAGANGVAVQLARQWDYYDGHRGDYQAYARYAGWAFQSQRTVYYYAHGLATAANDTGIPDIATDWSTRGVPARIEAVETKFSRSGQGFAASLKQPRNVGSELDRYQALYPGKWLLEVNRLTVVGAIELQQEGGVPFNTALYP